MLLHQSLLTSLPCLSSTFPLCCAGNGEWKGPSKLCSIAKHYLGREVAPPYVRSRYHSSLALTTAQQQHSNSTLRDWASWLPEAQSPNQVKGFRYHRTSSNAVPIEINSELDDGNLKSLVFNTHTHTYTSQPVPRHPPYHPPSLRLTSGGRRTVVFSFGVAPMQTA